MHLTLVGSQLNGKLVLVIAQRQFLEFVECFLEDDTSFISLADTQFLTEELQSAEDGFFCIIDIGHQLGVDDIHATYATHEDQAIARTTDRTLVIRSLLQAVLATETAHQERPLAIIFFLWHNV